jgi:hypothetical protein
MCGVAGKGLGVVRGDVAAGYEVIKINRRDILLKRK